MKGETRRFMLLTRFCGNFIKKQLAEILEKDNYQVNLQGVNLKISKQFLKYLKQLTYKQLQSLMLNSFFKQFEHQFLLPKSLLEYLQVILFFNQEKYQFLSLRQFSIIMHNFMLQCKQIEQLAFILYFALQAYLNYFLSPQDTFQLYNSLETRKYVNQQCKNLMDYQNIIKSFQDEQLEKLFSQQQSQINQNNNENLISRQ